MGIQVLSFTSLAYCMREHLLDVSNPQPGRFLVAIELAGLWSALLDPS